MIYIVSVLQLLLLLITVSSEQCLERKAIQVTGGTKESSQNGHYYGIISTPNFPQPFQFPLKQSWVIDASHHSNGTQINLYLTQMYLTKGVKFFHRPTYKFCDQGQPVGKHGPRQECQNYTDDRGEEIAVEKLHDLVRLSTTCPYLEIQVDVPNLYDFNYRTKDRFLFEVYGFNITFEIVPQKLGLRNDSCYPGNCSNLGHCYLAENWSDFFCDCVKDHPGRYCEFSPYCDPENNVTFCSNGGKCRIYGSNNGYCDCTDTGFTGPRCERNEQPKVSATRTVCSKKECLQEDSKPICSSDSPRSPCSCHPSPRHGRRIPKDWTKYEAIISVSRNYTTPRDQNSIGHEMQRNLSSWFKSSNLSSLENILVRFHSPQMDHHVELQIYFQGPPNLRAEVYTALKRWLMQGDHLYGRIPLLRNTLEVFAMPRVKFESVEVSKQTKLKIGKTVSLACTATTGPSNFLSKKDIQFRWFKDGFPINISLATRAMSIGQMPTNGNQTMSILMIDPVSAFDGGRYFCEVTDMEFGDQVCGYKDVEVVLPPQIEIEPMSLTLEKQEIGRGVVITCTDGSYSAYNTHNKSTEFFWFRSGSKQEVSNDDLVVLEDIIPQGKLLRILRAEHTENFTCLGFNKEGEERSRDVEVRVLDSKNSPSCNRHFERLAKSEKSLLWEWTAPNSVAMIPCPKNFIGYVQKQCIINNHGKVYWGRSDFSRCIYERLRRVNLTLQNAKRGFGDWETSNSGKLIRQLETYLNSSQMLYSGEGDKIIAILEDIVRYAYHSGKAQVDGLFTLFFRTVVKLLKIPNSCVQEKSLLTLSQIISDMAVRGAMEDKAELNLKTPHVIPSEVLLLQTLPISSEAKYQEVSYIFPRQDDLAHSSLSWLKDKLHVDFPLDSDGLRDAVSPMTYYLTMAAYKSLSSIKTPDDFMSPSSKNYHHQSIVLISPVFQITIPEGYYLPPDSHIKIHFNLSKENKFLISNSLKPKTTATKGIYFSCGAIDNSSISRKTDSGRLRWSMDVCEMRIQHNSYVECLCGKTGIYGLLKVNNIEDKIPRSNDDIPGIIIAGLAFCILSCVFTTAIVCVYLKFRISFKSLYALKLLDCLFVFAAVFTVLVGVGRSEMSSSWLLWSASSCSFLIAAFSTQVMKALRVLLMEAKSDMPGFIFPWLRNVSQITLLSAITFSTVLPMWTGTVAKVIGEDLTNESVFKETSHVFAIFVGTVGLVVLVFLGLYYKAVLKTKSEIDGYQERNPSCSVSSTCHSDMDGILNLKYRMNMKTLHLSLCLTLTLLVMTLAIILYENIPHSVYMQYFLGLSATAMGICLFMSYVTHPECSLSAGICVGRDSGKSLIRDPELGIQTETNGSQNSQKTYYDVSSVVTRNGSILGTTELLPSPPPPPDLSNQKYFRRGSESHSTSTVEEQSMDTFSTDISFHAPVTHQLSINRTGRSQNSGSNTVSSTGSTSYRPRKKQSTRVLSGKLEPGKCLIRCGDYVYPSNQNHLPSERPTLPTVSSNTNSNYNYNNYLPIRDHDDNDKV